MGPGLYGRSRPLKYITGYQSFNNYYYYNFELVIFCLLIFSNLLSYKFLMRARINTESSSDKCFICDEVFASDNLVTVTA